jgi:HlyD family secretion protein/epimerase transport system membrane fusion protein
MLDRLTPIAETLPGWLLEVLSRLGVQFGRAMDWLTATASRFGLAIDRGTVVGLMLALPIVVVALVLARRAIARRRRPDAGDTAPALSTVVRTPRLIGYVALVVFFGGFGSWAALSPLASAAVSPGVVSPDGSRKTVAHLEGGIVREIAVREGDTVHRGQKLLTLEDVRARAEFEALRERFVHLVTLEARLLAELVDATEIERPASLERFPDAAVTPALLAQQRLLESRRAAFAGREQILAQRIKQLEAEIAGLEAVIVAQDEQIALISEEVDTVADLLAKGLGGKPRLLALKRTRADIRAEQATSRASIARNEQAIGETRIRLLTMHEQLREAVSDELSRVRSELATVKSQLPSREDVLERTLVAAPLDGTVVNLRVTTESGVIQPGEPLLDLVPVEPTLIIDARVKPIDMDTVRTGQPARVIFPAYGQRNLPQITGRLRSVSADRLIDERSGEPYFLAKVEVDEAELQRLAPEIELTPGMPAEVMILTGERTMLDYLVRPFIQSITRSFRES